VANLWTEFSARHVDAMVADGTQCKNLSKSWWLQLLKRQKLTLLPNPRFGTERSEVQILSPRPINSKNLRLPAKAAVFVTTLDLQHNCVSGRCSCTLCRRNFISIENRCNVTFAIMCAFQVWRHLVNL